MRPGARGAGLALGHWRSGWFAGACPPATARRGPSVRIRGLRVAAFTLIAVVILPGALFALRAYQTPSVRARLDADYLRAPRRAGGDRAAAATRRARPPDDAGAGTTRVAESWLASAYLVVELSSRACEATRVPLTFSLCDGASARQPLLARLPRRSGRAAASRRSSSFPCSTMRSSQVHRNRSRRSASGLCGRACLASCPRTNRACCCSRSCPRTGARRRSTARSRRSNKPTRSAGTRAARQR